MANCPRCKISDQEILIVPRFLFWIPKKGGGSWFRLEIGTVNLSRKLGIHKFTFFEKIPLHISGKTLEDISAKLGLKISLAGQDIHLPDVADGWACFNCGLYKIKGQLFGER